MFSPHYARARKQGDADPFAHAGINVALCGKKRGWGFVEGAIPKDARRPDTMVLGASHVTRHEDNTIDIVFRGPGTTIDRPIAGRIRLIPQGPNDPAARPHRLDADGHHLWWPIAPNARVEVDFDKPQLQFSGRAYHDANAGTEPLSAAFVRWHWMRTQRAGGTEVVYGAVPVAGRRAALPLARWFGLQGEQRPLAVPQSIALKASRWGIQRTAYGDARLLGTVLDAPFYARSRLLIDGRDVAMHESLDLNRFEKPWNQFLLGFRMKRLQGES